MILITFVYAYFYLFVNARTIAFILIIVILGIMQKFQRICVKIQLISIPHLFISDCLSIRPYIPPQIVCIHYKIFNYPKEKFGRMIIDVDFDTFAQ